ncbi:FUSC family membrane protein [Desulfogranum japonicum]|uniref:FUSC family membrane protein n=1 Tax=Desulfogranum japonicum TaxID=231447 RepID=UPI000409EC8F|nr:FUSC family membrane protein [Desulfogranum japonicum]
MQFSIKELLSALVTSELIRRSLWTNPDRLLAIKTTSVLALVTVPLLLLGHSAVAVSLALGILSGALTETDDHPKGRVKALSLKVISFGISSLAVVLLRPYPVLLGAGLALSTMVFLIIGGISERYRGVTFGAILVGIYAMIGSHISPAWYWQPVLLPLGALIHGVFSLALLCMHPWRLLDEQLARGFLALAAYLEEKSRLFPSNEQAQEEIRNRLALLNVRLVNSLDQTREVLTNYGDALKDDTPLIPYLRLFMLLQSLHERAASSHEPYDSLSRDKTQYTLLEGIGQTLLQLAGACRLLANSQLAGVAYQHPVSLQWMVNAVSTQLDQLPESSRQRLALIVRNLRRSHISLQTLNDEYQRTMAPRLARDTRPVHERITDQLHLSHPRLRHAIRLSACLLAGFTIAEMLHLVKGEWILLTSLFVCQPTYSETRRRLLQRIGGTMAGVVLGVAVIGMVPTIAGQLLLMLGAAYGFFYWVRRKYWVSVLFISVFVLCVFNFVTSNGVAVMVPRLVDTTTGCLLAWLSVRFFWPEWRFSTLPGLLHEAIEKNSRYFAAILDEYQADQHDEDDLPYRTARRQAHRADNSLALAWQDMQVEPRNRQRFRQQAFALTYLNHALLSYVSAFGAHREQQEVLPPAVAGPAREVSAALESIRLQNAEGIVYEPGNMDNTLRTIKNSIEQSEPGVLRQQLTLLYNIADVTRQLIEQGRSLTEER